MVKLFFLAVSSSFFIFVNLYLSLWLKLLSVTVLRADGTECNARELGRITVRLPLPPGTMSTLYKAPERFVQTYFTRFKVSNDPFPPLFKSVK